MVAILCAVADLVSIAILSWHCVKKVIKVDEEADITKKDAKIM